jgi:hypothetical protein
VLLAIHHGLLVGPGDCFPARPVGNRLRTHDDEEHRQRVAVRDDLLVLDRTVLERRAA